MRFSNVILGLFSVGVVGAAALVGCGGGESGNTGGSGGGGNTTTTNSSSSSSGTASGGPCAPGASCKAADKECIGLVDNKDQMKFGLRMSQLDVTAPAALTTGIVAGIVSGAVTPSSAGCNLNGSATFNWLIQFDLAASTVKTGGAKPVSDPAAGYDFVDEMVNGKHLQPITFSGIKPDASGNFSITDGQDLLVPIYLDPAGSSVVLLPLKSARLTMGVLSASQNCIGHYNAEGLDPLAACLPDAKNKAFVDGAKLDGLITLEDADTVVISQLKQTLCVLLSQDASMYGMADSGSGNTVCKRDANMKIVFQGDTCSMAGQSCKDAVALSANFAASSIKINN